MAGSMHDRPADEQTVAEKGCVNGYQCGDNDRGCFRAFFHWLGKAAQASVPLPQLVAQCEKHENGENQPEYDAHVYQESVSLADSLQAGDRL